MFLAANRFSSIHPKIVVHQPGNRAGGRASPGGAAILLRGMSLHVEHTRHKAAAGSRAHGPKLFYRGGRPPVTGELIYAWQGFGSNACCSLGPATSAQS